MTRLTRRDLMSSLGVCASLLASRANAACDIWRDEIAGLPTKSYQCDVGNGQTLTTTFMRLSDVMFDSAGHEPLPDPIGEYQRLVRGHQLIDTPALSTFTRLFEKHSRAFEPDNMEVQFDMRGQGLSGHVEKPVPFESGLRWRSLGVWWDTILSYAYLPFFPLPSELRRAMTSPNDGGETFLRFATPADFSDMDSKTSEYLALWQSSSGVSNDQIDFGNLSLLVDIEAGSVPGFLPLIFDPRFGSFGGCDVQLFGGAKYMQPALYVDVVICRNDGTDPIRIDDMFGATDPTERLRPYDPATPPQAERFGWAPITLAPGQSCLAVQRLLFGAEKTQMPDGEEIKPKRAVYGATHLPKGVIVDGAPVPFNGRSHNAVILASFANCCSCPYLESWCPRAQEWIEHGKVMTEFTSPEKAGSDIRHFPELRTRFRLSEREHEDTTLTGAALTVTLEDGSNTVIHHPDAKRLLSIGECCELIFDVPHAVAARAVRSSLTLSGYYQTFSKERFDACAMAQL